MIKDAYAVINSTGDTVIEYPYTVDGFYQACAEVDGAERRGWSWRVINVNRVDLDHASGLTAKEKETAECVWGLVL